MHGDDPCQDHGHGGDTGGTHAFSDGHEGDHWKEGQHRTTREWIHQREVAGSVGSRQQQVVDEHKRRADDWPVPGPRDGSSCHGRRTNHDWDQNRGFRNLAEADDDVGSAAPLQQEIPVRVCGGGRQDQRERTEAHEGRFSPTTQPTMQAIQANRDIVRGSIVGRPQPPSEKARM